MNPLVTLDITQWNERPLRDITAAATDALENGQILFMPNLKFELLPAEAELLDPKWLGAGAKNIGFDPRTERLSHACVSGAEASQLTWMLARYAKCARQIATHLCPDYARHLKDGMTSLRPAQVKGRASSVRKDDTRLHLDSFVSRPTGGLRLLRVFHNINPHGEPRVWEIGETMPKVAEIYLDRAKSQLPGSAWLMERLGIVKGRRTEYDHLMLQLHDLAKLDNQRQQTCKRTRIELPAHSTWMVFTDGVEHAVMSGQYLLEQTFYLPVTAMHDEAKAPLRVLERMREHALV